MPLTPEDIDNLPTFTTAQLLKLTEWQIAQITATGQSLGQDGRTLTRANLPELNKQRENLKAEVATEAAGENGDGNVLARYRRES